MTRILFVHKSLSSFVETDLLILSARYEVEEWFQRGRWLNLLALVPAIWRSDVVFGWFASWHTFLPMLIARLIGRPTLLVVGGYDVANVPLIDYGYQQGGPKKWIGTWTMRLANSLVAFSNSSRREVIENVGLDGGKVCVSYVGVRHPQYVRGTKGAIAVTAGNINRSNFLRKGLEPFVRAAALVPEVNFVVIGQPQEDDAMEYLRSIASPNVRFTGWITDEELFAYFSHAAVYVQASVHEGFGLAVAEAMLCECVPIVTRAGSLPEVVGESGIYIESAEPDAIAKGVRTGLSAQPELGPRARGRIQREFPPNRRSTELAELISGAARNKSATRSN